MWKSAAPIVQSSWKIKVIFEVYVSNPVEFTELVVLCKKGAGFLPMEKSYRLKRTIQEFPVTDHCVIDHRGTWYCTAYVP